MHWEDTQLGSEGSRKGLKEVHICGEAIKFETQNVKAAQFMCFVQACMDVSRWGEFKQLF